MGLYDSPGGVNITRWYKQCSVDHESRISMLHRQVLDLMAQVGQLQGAVEWLLKGDDLIIISLDDVSRETEIDSALSTQLHTPDELGTPSLFLDAGLPRRQEVDLDV